MHHLVIMERDGVFPEVDETTVDAQNIVLALQEEYY